MMIGEALLDVCSFLDLELLLGVPRNKKLLLYLQQRRNTSL